MWHGLEPDKMPDNTIRRREFILLFLTDGFLCIAGLLLVSQLFTKNLVDHIMEPLDALSEGATRIRENDLTQDIEYSGEIEFENVCNTFNEMRRSILAGQEKNQKYEKARTDMIAGISHDLRTPLTAIRGTLKGLMDGVVSAPEHQKRFLETAYRRTGDMDVLLNQLFYLSKLEKEKIPIEEVPIHTIYRDGNNSNSHFRKFWDSVRIYKDIIKFTLSSFSSFILDYILFALIMAFLPHTAVYVLMANIAARFISAFYNYNMNCRFVFHTERKASTAIHYFVLAGMILLLNNLVLGTIVQFFYLPVYPAKLLTECLLFVFSWSVQKYIIFRRDGRFHRTDQDAAKKIEHPALPVLTGRKVGV